MFAFDRIVEQRILEAIGRGELDDLPGCGRPLELDDDSMIPAELRIAYRVLRNAGCVPPELDLRREVASLEALLDRIDDRGEHRRALRRLAVLRARLESGRARPASLAEEYRARVLATLGRDGPAA